MKNSLIKLKNPPSIISTGTIVGNHEHEGPLGSYFDFHDTSNEFGKNTWEKSEMEMQRIALNTALSKIKMDDDEIEAIFAGDLLNQCTISSNGLINFKVPFYGLYGACSTIAEGLILSSMLLSAGYYDTAAAVTSSHYCTAERQYRMPLEYGGQRSPTAQWTVTGAGAYIMSSGIDSGIYINEVMPGRVVEKGINDPANMGAAMAPAAVDTLSRYFTISGKRPDEFDLILTGDLGYEGYTILLDLMRQSGYDLDNKLSDCGLLIYDREKLDVHSGGSGCGCSAVTLSGYILHLMRERELNDILFVGTGALMSPQSVQQGLNIAGIAHLVRIVNYKEAFKNGADN
jgi:stage V sporulation protein AD